MTTRDHFHVDELVVALVMRSDTGAHYVVVRTDRGDDVIDMNGDEARAFGHSLLEVAADFDRARAGLPLLGGVGPAERLS